MRLTRLLLGVALLGGCRARGVDVGSEALCEAEPLLAAVATTERISSCARIGANLLRNPGFELPNLASCATLDLAFCHLPSSEVPGWSSSSALGLTELWQDQYEGVPAPEGRQFGELDAESQDTLWQEFEVAPGLLLYWSLLHRGRSGLDTFEVRLGPPEAPAPQGIFSSANDAWYTYTGLYRVPGGQTTTRFALVSRSGIHNGNLVDAVMLAAVE